MSSSAISQLPTTNSHVTSQITSDDIGIVMDPRNYLFLIPTITAIGIGAIFIPHFGLGLAVGAAELVLSRVGFYFLDRSGILPQIEEKNSKYHQKLRSALLEVSVFGPIAEEGIFRGIVQPLLTRSVQILVPATAVALFGPSLSIAVVVSIIATSIFFGAVHYWNPHKNAHIQAIDATIGGLVLGFLSAQFGIGASIGAHIAYNTTISSIIALLPEKKTRPDISTLPA